MLNIFSGHIAVWVPTNVLPCFLLKSHVTTDARHELTLAVITDNMLFSLTPGTTFQNFPFKPSAGLGESNIREYDLFESF
jgi:hypothetical protein